MTDQKSTVLSDSSLSLEGLNLMPQSQAAAFFFDICHCNDWAQSMANARPFVSIDGVLEKADILWSEATDEMILESFLGHAKIGDREAIRQKFSAAAKEQGQIGEASDAVIDALAEGNQLYFEKNQFIFIVCATGKSAEEMLELLNGRLPNTREQELKNGAREQGKITELRLRQRLAE